VAPGPGRRAGQPPVPLTVLCGFDRHAVADTAAALLLAGSRLAAVWADPFTAELGYVQTRVTDSDGRYADQAFAVQEGCLPSTVRAATVHAVRRLHRTGRYDAMLVHLHPGIEATSAIAALTAELAGTAVVDTVGLLLHPGWAVDLAGPATVASKGIALARGDDRGAAPVLAAALSAVTAIVAPGVLDQVTGPAEDALLSVLAPGAARLHPATPFDVTPAQLVRTGRFDPAQLDPLAARGLMDPRRTLPSCSGSLRLARWRAQRPVHPQRLRDALGHLADGVIRSTGHLRFATRPYRLAHWDSAGDRLFIGPLGAVPPPAPGTGHPPRRPYHNHLAFLGNDLDTGHIRQVLDSCLLTDRELPGGPAAWRQLADPFPDWDDAGHGTTASDDTAPGSGRAAPGVPGAPGSRTETA